MNTPLQLLQPHQSEGAMEHRDSTGAVQRIEPGAINWMSAGRGIAHSERTPQDQRGKVRRSHGLQLWAALPAADEEMAPSFAHTPVAALPQLELGGAVVRVLIGTAFGATSPVAVRSPTLVLDIAMQPGDAFPLPNSMDAKDAKDAKNATERALYVVAGAVELDGVAVPPHTMVLLPADDEPLLSASATSRAVLIGGEPLGQRHIWWNFVASSKERIEKAADDWAAGRFDTVPGETEFIPLPERRP